jgi:hypothetical protein
MNNVTKMARPNNSKRLPERRLDHRHEKRGEEKRNGCEHCARPGHAFPTIIFEDLIDYAVPTRLHFTRALRVRIFAQSVRLKNRFAAGGLVELPIVKCALLRNRSGC